MEHEAGTGPDQPPVDYRGVMAARHQRNTNRRVFREMIRSEAAEGSIGWLRRRTLIRFAIRLGIDPFEARLIVRAVEHECGLATTPPASDGDHSFQTEYVATPRHLKEDWRIHAIAIGVMAAIAAGFWLVRSGF